MNEMRKLMEAVEFGGGERCPDCYGSGHYEGVDQCERCEGFGEIYPDDSFHSEFKMEEDADSDAEWELRKAVQNKVVPQVGDDGNPEEWIQLMIYAFDDLDVPFNVNVAKDILADYGMEPHTDLEARFGESIEEELEVIGEDQGIKFRDTNEYIFTIASRLRKLQKHARREYEEAESQGEYLELADVMVSFGLVLEDIDKLVELVDESSIRNQGGVVYPPRSM